VEQLLPQLVAMGYRRGTPGGAPRGVRRAGRHRRRVPLDGRRPGPHRSLGGRGGPADGLLGQRSALVTRPARRRALWLPGSWSSPRRCAGGRRARGAPALGAGCGRTWPRARSSTAWSRGCPSSTTRPASSPIFCRRRQIVLVEPRRIRDRGVQLLDEEAALAETLAATWGAKEGEEEPFPRLHVPFERLLSESAAGVTALPSVPEGPDMATLTVRRFEPVPGTPPAWPPASPHWSGRAMRSPCAPPLQQGPGGSRPPWPPKVCTRRCWPRRQARRRLCGGGADSPPGSSCPRPRWRALGDRRHRAAGPAPAARPRARAADGFFDDLEARELPSCTANTAWRASRA